MEQATSGDLAFYPSKNSALRLTRLGLWSGVAIGMLIQLLRSGDIAATASTTSFWIINGFMFLLCAVLDRHFSTLMDTKRALATITDTAFLSPKLSGKVKALPWQDVASVALVRTQGTPSLQFALQANSPLLAQTGFWGSLGGGKLVLPLSSLGANEQAQLLDAINLQLSRVQGRAFADMPPNELAQENAFKQQLEQLSPTPWVTYGLIAINVAVWMLTVSAGASVMQAPADKLLAWGGNATSAVQHGEWWRLLTATFLHSGLMHVAMNMLGLYSAGVMLERIYGPRLFAIIYFGAGLIGSALSLSYAAQQAVSVGASGAVFGVTGALLVVFLRHRDKLPAAMGKQTISGLGFFILYSLLQGFSHQGIDNAAHIGGLLGGCMLAWILPERLDMDNFRRTQQQRAAVAIVLACACIAGLALKAPAATLDQQRVFSSNELLKQTFQDYDKLTAELRQEAENIRSEKISALEADERSRTVFAPRFKQISVALSEVVLRPNDPRAALVKDVHTISELMAESLAMESSYPEGSDKPMPINPERSKQIVEELKRAVERFNQDIVEINALAGKKAQAPK